MKLSILLIAALLFVGAVNAQSFSGFSGFFGPLHKPVNKSNPFSHSTTPLPDSTFFGFRPVASLIVQAFPGNFTQAGAGISLEHDTYKPSTTNMYTDWSAFLLAYGGYSLQALTTPIPPTTPTSVFGVGAGVSILNKRISLGGEYAFKNPDPTNNNHWLFTVGTSLSIIP
jgi:hypothetical protein